MGGDDLLSLRLAALREFVLVHVPPPARILEVGCGEGKLALALAGADYFVTAIDPVAPEGALFRRTRLEDFATDGDFDAVVASLSLHHVDSLDAALEKIASLLRPGGLIVLEEFAKERMTGATARWYYHQRQASAAAAGLDETALPDAFEAWLRRWVEEHAGIHPSEELRRGIGARFAERYFAWTPYLFDYWLDDALEPLERKLIESGAIDAIGFRYVGERQA